MEDKFKLTRDQNVFMAKRKIVDYIWKSANLEGINVTFPQTQVIYDGGIINGLKVSDVIAVNNLKYAWDFLLESENIDYDYNFITHIHRLTVDKLLTEIYVGKLRTIPVSISGTDWKPAFPI